MQNINTPLEQFEMYNFINFYKYPITHTCWTIFEFIDANIWSGFLNFLDAIYDYLYVYYILTTGTTQCSSFSDVLRLPGLLDIGVSGILLGLLLFIFYLLHLNLDARNAYYFETDLTTPKNIIAQPLMLNSTAVILLVFFGLVFLVMTMFLSNRILLNNYQILFMKYFSTIEQIIRDLITNKTGKQYYYSLLMFLFIFINVSNLHSLVPYSYAITSNFAVTFTLSFIFFCALNLTGIFYHGIYLLNLFFPSGTPFIILPLLIIIEIISYFARMFSLAIRLFANITAGHILLKILSWFTYLLKNVFFVAIIISLVISSLWVLEFFISILQAYVFLILLCIYVNEVLQLH